VQIVRLDDSGIAVTPEDQRASTPGNWRLSPPFRRQGSAGWVADLPPELHRLTDTNEQPRVSGLRLFEDGTPLGPAHSEHRVIRTVGSGRYSFWGDVLYFSTSDGRDPGTNGRVYEIRTEIQESLVNEPKAEARRLIWTEPPRPLRCAVYGLGNRGVLLGRRASVLAGVEVTWLVDVSGDRIAEARTAFGEAARGTTSLVEPLSDPDLDIVIVAVPDHLHRTVAEQAFRAGKHVYVEKPLATTAADAWAILRAWRKSGRILQVGYVLRQTPFYSAIRRLLQAGTLGQIRVAYFSEQLQVRHGASFMRRWHASSALSGGLIVHKACHDLDLICWLLNARPRVVGSLGGSELFTRRAPAPFCSQCPEQHACPYVDTALHEHRTARETADPSAFGLDRCVFHGDKDIVDHQVVAFELETGTRGSFHLSMQGPVRNERRITLVGDRATLDGTFEDAHFTVRFEDDKGPPLLWSGSEDCEMGHGGGDQVTMHEFLDACAGRSQPPIESHEETMRGLVFALAAERARKQARLVQLGTRDFADEGVGICEEPLDRRDPHLEPGHEAPGGGL